MISPGVECLALLIGKVLMLVDADDASEAAADVVQDFFDHRQLDTQPRHSGGAGPSQIVQPPCRHVWRQQRIQAAPGDGIAGAGRCAGGGENEWRANDPGALSIIDTASADIGTVCGRSFLVRSRGLDAEQSALRTTEGERAFRAALAVLDGSDKPPQGRAN